MKATEEKKLDCVNRLRSDTKIKKQTSARPYTHNVNFTRNEIAPVNVIETMCAVFLFGHLFYFSFGGLNDSGT